LKGPIKDLTLLQRGLCFAELSLFSYLVESDFVQLIGQLGFRLDGTFTSHHGQAFLLRSPLDVALVFRGSGERDWEELQGEQQSLSIFAETIGKVHRCFKEDVDELWPQLEKTLETNRHPVWFCGHSLGGAFANICAQRCLLSYIRSEPEELHSFGSPRIGSKKYVRLVELQHFRWVNYDDPVTQMPAAWRGYRHSGNEMYLDRQGELKNRSAWRLANDRLKGALDVLGKRRIRPAHNHSIIQYVDRIFNLVRAEKPICVASSTAKASENGLVSSAIAEPHQSFHSAAETVKR
jgi:triacylglycerol lipase